MTDTCGCCEGIAEQTPATVANRPGLSALAYRVGTYASFLATMKARLSNHHLDVTLDRLDANGQPQQIELRPLQALTTRAADDPAIALLDAWATVADVLTFYQERIANEGYLRTATERRSILELTRLVGYRLRPGVAASTYLAFDLEQTAAPLEIPPGTRAQSLPGPGELPQPFETADPLPARLEWNKLTPRMNQPQVVSRQKINQGGGLYVKGIATGLKPNDPLLIDFGGDDRELYRILDVKPDSASDRTLVKLQLWQAAATTERLNTAVRTIAERARSNVPSTSAVADNTLRTINRIVDLAASTPASRLRRELEADRLPTLRELRRNARGQRFQRWFDDLLHNLDQAVATTNGDGDDGSNGDGQRVISARSTSRVTNVGQLIPLLGKPASVPPANALRLQRSVKRTYDVRSDTSAKIVSALRPDVGRLLYRGWQNLQESDPSTAVVYALRTRASVFGHNAPLEPDQRNENGVIISYKEWSLRRFTRVAAQSFRITALLAAGDPDTHGVTLSTSIALGDASAQSPARRLIEESFTVDLGGSERVTVTVSDIQTDVEFGLLSLRLRFAFEQSGIVVQANAQPVSNEVQATGDEGTVQATIASATMERTHEGQQTVINGRARIPVDPQFTEQPRVISLDAPYPQIVPQSWVVVERPTALDDIPSLVIATAEQVAERTRADYGITAKGTQIQLNQDWIAPARDSFAVIRGSTVFAQSERLTLAEEPVTDDVGGAQIALDGLYDGLESGRWLIVTGERTDIPGVSGVPGTELIMLAGVRQTANPDLPGDTPHSTLLLSNDLAYTYKRGTVTIYANVVRATHGETRNEPLGNGDGSQAMQSFTLHQSPLTYLAAPTPAGAESTLRVRVNDVLWHETDSLAGLGPTDRRYITRTDDDDKTTVIFGNGDEGARLPTGLENVQATYRTGIGKPGNVPAGQISLLVTRPLGVKGVINPLPATGGADRESRDQARQNAPLGVTALDRLVSVRDYEDFARTFAGIGKASAQRLSDGERQVVHLTIAGADDIPIDLTSDLYRNLRLALHRSGDPYQPVRLAIRELILLIISAGVQIDPDYQWEKVAPNIRAALLDAFSFARRELGQDALLSEVISTIQAVAGVVYVDVDTFGGIPETVPSRAEGQRQTPSPRQIAEQVQALVDESKQHGPLQRVAVNLAVPEGRTIRPAQIALLSPTIQDTLFLREIRP